MSSSSTIRTTTKGDEHYADAQSIPSRADHQGRHRRGCILQIVQHDAGLPVALARPEDREAAAQGVSDQRKAVLRRLQSEGRGIAEKLAGYEAIVCIKTVIVQASRPC